jgi:hypothetical protein
MGPPQRSERLYTDCQQEEDSSHKHSSNEFNYSQMRIVGKRQAAELNSCSGRQDSAIYFHEDSLLYLYLQASMGNTRASAMVAFLSGSRWMMLQ